MKIEIAAYIHQNTWITVHHRKVDNSIKSLWSLNSIDSQMEFQASAELGWAWEGIYRRKASLVTCQVHYNHAFVQAELTETVFVEPPQLVWPKSGKNLVLKLL